MTLLIDERLCAIRTAVEYAYGARVEGDIGEWGVMNGYSASALLNGIIEFSDRFPDADRKRLWLCDSFQGFPKATSDIDISSPMVATGIWGEGGSRGFGREVIEYTLRGFLAPDRFVVVEGWYAETAAKFAAAGNKFALLHVDCDLYQSTMDVLTPLLQQGCIAEGAMVLFDDWNGNYANPKFGQRRAWRELVDKFAIEASDEGAYGAYSHKFIVHGYDAT